MFTELTANILYLSVCLCICRCMYRTWEEREASSGGLGAVSCVSFFFLHVFDSSSIPLSAPLAAVSGAVSSSTARFHPWPTDAGGSATLTCFGGVKSKMFACQPACTFKGFLFHRVTITRRLLCFSCGFLSEEEWSANANFPSNICSLPITACAVASS